MKSILAISHRLLAGCQLRFTVLFGVRLARKLPIIELLLPSWNANACKPTEDWPGFRMLAWFQRHNAGLCAIGLAACLVSVMKPEARVLCF